MFFAMKFYYLPLFTMIYGFLHFMSFSMYYEVMLISTIYHYIVRVWRIESDVMLKNKLFLKQREAPLDYFVVSNKSPCDKTSFNISIVSTD